MEASKHAPLEDRRGLALCLSRGGYRAALFHIGALRRLNELGALSKVETISAVSGGAIVAAHLAGTMRPWPAGPLSDWDQQVQAPLRTLTKQNVRTSLSAAYRLWLTQLPLSLLADPSLPRCVISATDLQFGASWVFDGGDRWGGQKARMGDGAAGFAPLPDWPLARVVAVSSAAPPFFDPLPLDLDPADLEGGGYRAPDRDELVADIRLTDGGVIDNMGLEAVWREHRVVLVSNGGAPFRPSVDRGPIWRVLRYADVQGRQGEQVRKRWLIRSFETGELAGSYWGIESSPVRYRPASPGYSKELAGEVISRIRTDLDRFSEAEAEVLVTHGYFLADAALRTHVSDLIVDDRPFSIPAPDAASERLARRLLWRSHRRTLLGRGWPT